MLFLKFYTDCDDMAIAKSPFLTVLTNIVVFPKPGGANRTYDYFNNFYTTFAYCCCVK